MQMASSFAIFATHNCLTHAATACRWNAKLAAQAPRALHPPPHPNQRRVSEVQQVTPHSQRNSCRQLSSAMSCHAQPNQWHKLLLHILNRHAAQAALPNGGNRTLLFHRRSSAVARRLQSWITSCIRQGVSWSRDAAQRIGWTVVDGSLVCSIV